MVFPHKFTKEESSKGGKKVTDIKRIKLQLAARKKCDKKCPLYPCTVQRQSLELGNKCAFKELPIEARQAEMNILFGGKEGLLKELRTLMKELLAGSKNDKITRKERRQLMSDIALYNKIVYGDKSTMVVDIPKKIEVEWMETLPKKKK